MAVLLLTTLFVIATTLVWRRSRVNLRQLATNWRPTQMAELGLMLEQSVPRSSTLDLDAAAAAQGDGSLLTVGSNALSMHGGTEPADVTSSVDSKSALVNTGPA